jgi:pantoate kinase
VKRTAEAFAPGAISSFFEICDTQNGYPITDLEKMGAIGGGFGLEKGTHTKVTVQPSHENKVDVYINSWPIFEAKTTKAVTSEMLAKTSAKYAVTVEHQIDLPIGTGFGTSAGGALTAALALSTALDLPLTYNQLGKIAHIAEIQCQTGLGTVSSLSSGGGCILVTAPGAPGICQIDRIPMSSEYVIVAGYLDSKIPKKEVLGSAERRKQLDGYGKETLEAVLAKPTLENFLDSCWLFAQKAGFTTPEVSKLVELAKTAGAVGAAQNMIGHAVHAIVKQEKASLIAEAFNQILPSTHIITSKIDLQGARLVK